MEDGIRPSTLKYVQAQVASDALNYGALVVLGAKFGVKGAAVGVALTALQAAYKVRYQREQYANTWRGRHFDFLEKCYLVAPARLIIAFQSVLGIAFLGLAYKLKSSLLPKGTAFGVATAVGYVGSSFIVGSWVGYWHVTVKRCY